MEIKPPANDIHTAITRSIASTTQSSDPNSVPPDWKIAQQIKAVITQITDKQLFLDIQGIKANTIKPNIADLQVGDILKLQIEQLKPMPQFRIVGLQKNLETNLVTQALKNMMSQNTSLNPLLKNIHFIATSPALRPAPLSIEVNAAVRNIFQQIPSPFNLKTGSQVNNQLQNSGLFIENKIKNHIFSAIQASQTHKTSNIKAQLSSGLESVFKNDLGAQLHRLANLIKTQLQTTSSPTTSLLTKNITQPNNIQPAGNKAATPQGTRAPAEQASLQNITSRDEAMQTFLRQIESSLTHLQQNQLQNLNESQAGRPMWLMELPIKNGQDIDLFKLRISEEDETETEGEIKKIWNITLQFDLTGLGKIKSHIKMQNDYISAQFFSEKTETLALFQENLDFLRGRLNYNGLNVGNIECAHKKITEEQAPINIPRLDERT